MFWVNLPVPLLHCIILYGKCIGNVSSMVCNVKLQQPTINEVIYWFTFLLKDAPLNDFMDYVRRSAKVYCPWEG